MKKGQVLEAKVERVDFPNKGIVNTGEGTVTVKNSLPGQKIKLSVNKVRRGKAEGRLIEVVEKSPLETGRPCSHFGVCGGCTYLSLPYEEQLRIKEEQVKRLLDGVLNAQDGGWIWEGLKGSPAVYEYRNKMEFSFGDEVKNGPLALGMHKRGSFYDVVTVSDCRIVDGDYRLILETTRAYFAEKNIGFYHKLTHQGYLRHLVVRKASRTGEILAALVTTSQSVGAWSVGDAESEKDTGPAWSERVENEERSARDAGSVKEAVSAESVGSENGSGSAWSERVENEERSVEGERPAGKKSFTEDESLSQDMEHLLQGFLEALLSLEHEGKISGHFAGILHIINDSQADVVRSDRTEVLYGQDYFYEEILGLRFKISAFSFFQTNSYSAEVLYEAAREYVGSLGADDAGKPESIVYDLYSGTGTIAQLMAPVAKKVIGVEIVEEAVEAARRNAAENGIKNCEFIAGDVLKVLEDIPEKPDLIILDPPRDGIHPKALPKIISYGVDRIIYISCKPTSLVRDLEVFLKNGYQVKRAVAVDQFPWTANVEAVCLLSKLNVEHHIEVELNLDEMDFDSCGEQGCL